MMGDQWLKSIRFKLQIIENDLSIGLDNDNHVETCLGDSMIQHQSIKSHEIDLERYIEKSNDVNILVKASYNKEINRGQYQCMMLYKQHKKLIEGIIDNAISPNYIMILGLIETVKHIALHKVNVCIISGIYVGFKKAAKNKGKYFKEVNEIVHIVESQGNTINSIAITDGMDVIKKYIIKNL